MAGDSQLNFKRGLTLKLNPDISLLNFRDRALPGQ
jgi:hypothetical protein